MVIRAFLKTYKNPAAKLRPTKGYRKLPQQPRYSPDRLPTFAPTRERKYVGLFWTNLLTLSFDVGAEHLCILADDSGSEPRRTIT